MKVEVFYTCGGVWLSEVDLNENEYAVVSTEYPNELAIYTKEDEDDKYHPEDMILVENKNDLPNELRKIYDTLYTELMKKASN